MTAVLPQVLQSCIAQAAVAVFGCPGKHACPKVRQSWYDEECKVARASMKHLLPGTNRAFSKEAGRIKHYCVANAVFGNAKPSSRCVSLLPGTPRLFGNITRKGS